MERVLVKNEDAWGQITAAKLGTIQRLEMADVIEQINAWNDRFVDDALRVHGDIMCGRSG